MKIGFWNYYSSLNDRLFTDRNAPIGDDLLLPFLRLKEAGAARGIECVVADGRRDLDATVFIDFPDLRDPKAREVFFAARARYLIVLESPLVRPVTGNEGYFHRIFTWDDTASSLPPTTSKFVKLNYAQEFPARLPFANPRDQLCMIASAKKSHHPASLYGRRAAVVEFFDRKICPRRESPVEHRTTHGPAGWSTFDLYGPGWDGAKCWRGTIAPGLKRAALAKYRYAIVFENGRFPGYITEKLFDCLIAGTVPIYCGAPNVHDYIPGNCYVDMDAFSTLAEMWRWIDDAPRTLYAGFYDAIERFVRSELIGQFSIERWTKTVLDTIDGDLTIV